MEYLYGIIIIVGLYVILATSFNLIIGYGGLISIAHPVFFALGAYTSAVLARDFGVPIILAHVRGHGALPSLPRLRWRCRRLRVSGDYLLIASIGFQLGLLEVIKNLRFTGGAGGYTNIPPFLIREFGRESYVLLVLAVMVAVILLVRWIARSDYGRAMSAMRDDELAFAALGRDAMWMKVTIFALGCGFAGFAGALYAHYFRFIVPEQFEILQSAAILTMVVVGGLRTTWGPIIGALLLQALPQALTFLNLPPSVLGPIQGLLFTGLVLVFMFVRPQGLVPAEDVWRGAGRTSTWCEGGPMTAVLEIRGLNKSFDGIVVASDIELTLEAGRVVGLIGPNGAGKTSLFNLVSGVVEPDAGTVTLAGMPLDGLKLHERIRRGLSRTWQHTRLFPSLSVIDNLLAGTHDYPGERLFTLLFSRSQIKRTTGRRGSKANDILGRMGLARVANGLVSDLPYGQQKLVGVARALMGEAKCLLLDEPMAGVEGQSYAAMQTRGPRGC